MEVSSNKKHWKDIFHKLFNQCNQEQRNFILTSVQHMKLIGVPGAGKSTTIVSKIIYHFLKKDFICPYDYIMITFSKQAQTDFLEKGRKYDQMIFQNMNIRTLHSLSIYLLTFSNIKNYTLSSVILHATKFIEHLPEDQLYKIPLLSHCRFIFIDEAQDINDMQYNLIHVISKKYNIPFCCIGDPNQSIYQFQGGNEKFMMTHKGNIYPVIKNYRSTFEIIQFANYFLPQKNLTEDIQCGSLSQGNIPRLFFGSYQDIRDDLILSIRTSPYEYEQIAILSPVKKAKPLGVNYFKNMGLYWICNILMEEEIPFQLHVGNNNSNDIKEEKKKGHIQLYTFHGSKGLEWDQVFLLNFNWQTQGSNPTEEKYKELKYLWYVAMTRAKKDMTLYGLSSKYIWKDLKDCPKNLYELDVNSKEMKLPPEGKDFEFGVEREEKDKKDEKLNLDYGLYTQEKWKEIMLKMDVEYEIEIENKVEGIIKYGNNEEEKKDMFSFFSNFKKVLFYFYFFMNKPKQKIIIKDLDDFIQREKETIYITKKDSYHYHICMKYIRKYIQSKKDEFYWKNELSIIIDTYMNVQNEELSKKWFLQKIVELGNCEKVYFEYENTNQKILKKMCLDTWNRLHQKRSQNKVGWEEFVDLLFYKYQKEEECKFLYKYFLYDQLVLYAKNYWQKVKKLDQHFFTFFKEMENLWYYTNDEYEGTIPIILRDILGNMHCVFFLFESEKENSLNRYRMFEWNDILLRDFRESSVIFYECNLDTLELNQFMFKKI